MALENAIYAFGKITTSLKVRRSHLKRRGRRDPITEELLARAESIEEYAVGIAAGMLKEHPAYPWFSRILGVGRENIGKCLGPIRIKPADEFICPGKKCGYFELKNGRTTPPLCPKCKTQMIDPPYADTPSALHKFAGGAPEDGKSPKRTPGVRSSYNSRLRSMFWRLMTAMLKAGLRQKCLKCSEVVGQTTLDKKENDGHCPRCRNDTFATIAISKFAQKYLDVKSKYIARYLNTGYKIVPASALPTDEEDKKYEPPGVISEGHIHNMAMKWTVKLFQTCLWLVWREAEGLPLTKPYPISILGHSSFIDPWTMCDKAASREEKTSATERATGIEKPTCQERASE